MMKRSIVIHGKPPSRMKCPSCHHCQPMIRTGVGSGLLAGEHEDADTDDRADTNRGQLPDTHDPAEVLVAAGFGLQLLDRLVTGQLGGPP